MKQSKELIALQDKLGHRFDDPRLLARALTHSSMSSPNRDDNQRLEFLGDRVLGLVMSEAVLEHDAEASEGKLAPRFNALVRKETCAEIAQSLGLGEALRLGRSERLSGGRRKQALLGDAMEAVIAAIYVDAGFDKARKVVRRLWGDRVENVEEDARDPKTTLQEWAQARGMEPPHYEDRDRTGPDHAPVFTVRVTVGSGQTAEAAAKSKRAAQQDAARALLKTLGE